MSAGSHLRIEPWGTNAQGVELFGDPKRPEHAEFYVKFPGGEVGVCRTSDGQYWVHVVVPRPGAGGYSPDDGEGRITDARLDIVGRHANEVDRGDFEDPNLYHLAVKVAKIR